jgi:hypothetical protein
MDVDNYIATHTVEVGDCLEWTGTMVSGSSRVANTPVVHTTVNGKSKNLIVTRYVWARKNGPVPAGQVVFRTCCNNACVDEDHLAAGTRKDLKAARKAAGQTRHDVSTRASMKRSAQARPQAHTALQARCVRELLAAGLDRESIAEQSGISPAMVKEIHLGRKCREMLPGSSVFHARGVL